MNRAMKLRARALGHRPGHGEPKYKSWQERTLIRKSGRHHIHIDKTSPSPGRKSKETK